MAVKVPFCAKFKSNTVRCYFIFHFLLLQFVRKKISRKKNTTNYHCHNSTNIFWNLIISTLYILSIKFGHDLDT